MVFKLSMRPFKGLEILLAFFTVGVIAEIALHILGSLGTQSAWVFHVFTLIEYFLVTSALGCWQNKSTKSKLMRVSIPIYVLFYLLVKFIGLENFEAGLFNIITRPIALLLLSIFAFLTLQDLWRHTPSNLTDDYRFWMLLAMVFYYSASLVLFAFMFTRRQPVLIALFKIHAVVNIIHNLLFTIGVFKVRAAQKVALQPSSPS